MHIPTWLWFRCSAGNDSPASFSTASPTTSTSGSSTVGPLKALAGLVEGILRFCQGLLPSGATTQLPHLDEVLLSSFRKEAETSLPAPFNQATFSLLIFWLLQLTYSTPMIWRATPESANSFGYVAPCAVVKAEPQKPTFTPHCAYYQMIGN